MSTLTDGQLRALRNLADKQGGSLTAFLNIADASHLTELGFAMRSRQGWDITTAGAAHLASVGGAAPADRPISFLRPGDNDAAN